MITREEAIHILRALVASRSLATSTEAKKRAKSIAEKIEAMHPGVLVESFAQTLVQT